MIYLFIVSTVCIYLSLLEHIHYNRDFLIYLLIFPKNQEQCMHKSLYSDICRRMSQYHWILPVRGPDVESQLHFLSLRFLHLK